jgi:molybdopterin-guanine dinucleotide biosynthesis protein A
MGQDKANLVIDGEPLAVRTAALLLAVAAPVIEVGPGYTGLLTVREAPPGSGPLAAVAAGAAALAGRGHAGPALVVATDLPRLTGAYLEALANASGDETSAVPRDPSGRPQPLCARYSAAALATAQRLVTDGHRSMAALLDRVPVAWFDGPAATEVLCDVDTPEDLAAMLRGAAR